MDIAAQRSQAYALIDALPQDSLELVVSLLRKLAGNVQPAGDSVPCNEAHAAHVALLSEYKGIGGHIWEEEPQAYVSALRSEEREL